MNVNSSSLTKTCKLLGWMGKKIKKKEINCNTQNKMWICCYNVIGLFVQKKNVHLNENWISSGKYAYEMSELTKEIETKSSWKKNRWSFVLLFCVWLQKEPIQQS